MWARYGLEILIQCGERINSESKKVFGSNKVDVTGEKLTEGEGEGVFAPLLK